MRIAYDYQIFADQRYGGISRYFYEVARRLAARRDCDVRLIAGLHLNEYLREAVDMPVQGFYVPRVRKTFRLRRAVNQGWLRTANAVAAPDVLHETYYGASSRVPGRTRIVTTVHDMIHELAPHYFRADTPEPAARKAAIARSSAVIAVSEATRRDLIQVLGPNIPITVIPHGFTAMVPDDESRARVRALCNDEPFVLFVGKRGLYKNFDALATAYGGGFHREARLVLFGGDPISADEQSLWTSVGIPPGAIVRVDGDDRFLAALYEKARLFVYPSLHEGFGMPILEAFSIDCPVLCSDIDAFREVAGDAALYCATDADGFDDGLRRGLAQDRSAGSAARAARLADFSWDRCAAAHAAVYAEAVR